MVLFFYPFLKSLQLYFDVNVFTVKKWILTNAKIPYCDSPEKNNHRKPIPAERSINLQIKAVELQIKEVEARLNEVQEQRRIAERKIIEFQNIACVLQQLQSTIQFFTKFNLESSLVKMAAQNTQTLSGGRKVKSFVERLMQERNAEENGIIGLETQGQHIHETTNKKHKENLRKLSGHDALNRKTFEHDYEYQIKKCLKTVIEIIESDQKDCIQRINIGKRSSGFHGIANKMERLKNVIRPFKLKILGIETEDMKFRKGKVDLLTVIEVHEKIEAIHKNVMNTKNKYLKVL